MSEGSKCDYAKIYGGPDYCEEATVTIRYVPRCRFVEWDFQGKPESWLRIGHLCELCAGIVRDDRKNHPEIAHVSI